MSEKTINWPGQSGKEYKYWVYSLDTQFKDSPGNYIYTKKTSPGRWSPVYIGQSRNLKERLSGYEIVTCARQKGATHVHVHGSAGEAMRKAEEKDLIVRWDPPCNKKQD